jgi:PAS domain S-box-containing protein
MRHPILKSQALAYLGALLAAGVVLAVVWVADRLDQQRVHEANRTSVIQRVSIVRARLEGALNARLFLTRGLVGHVSIHPEAVEADFEDLARALMAGNTGIRSIQLAKNTIVSHLYPLRGNEEARGLRLLELPDQRAAVQQAIESKRTLVAGPVQLVQGGVAFVSRTPIYLTPPGGSPASGPYWGLATILIDRDTLLKEAGLFDTSTGLQYALRGKDGLGAQGEVFFGDTATFESMPVILDVSLPNGSWQLAGIPVGGWAAVSPRLWTIRIGGGFLALVAGALAFVATLHHRQVSAREHRLRLMVEHLPVGAVYVEGDHLLLNKTAEAITGYQRSELTTRAGWFHTLHGPQAAVVQERYEADRAAGVPAAREVRITRRDGEERIVEFVTYRFDGGEVWLLYDITERVRAVVGLRATEERYRILYEENPAMYFTVDERGTVLSVNDFGAEQLGYTVEELLRQPVLNVFHPEDRGAALQHLNRCLENPEHLYNWEVRKVRKDGGLMWVREDARAVRGMDGRPVVLIVCEDITERKRAEEALRQAYDEMDRRVQERTAELSWTIKILQDEVVQRRQAQDSLQESRERFRQLAETTRAIPWEADARTWQFTYVGPQAVELFGYPLAAWYEKDFWVSHIHPDDRKSAVDFCLESSRHLEHYEFQYRMIAADGRTVWLNDIVHVKSTDGTPETLRGYMLDISERKWAEEDLQRLREQLAHVTRVTTMGELTASLAHELNQPLTAIVSNAQAGERFLAAPSPPLAEVREILEDIVADGQRAGEVIRRLRGLLKKGEFEFAPLDLNEVIGEVVMLAGADALVRNVPLALELDSNLPPVRGDRVQLQQVLLNLILNGLEAMGDGVGGDGKLVIQTDLGGGGTVRVAVRDSGVGIPENTLDRVFEPFYSTKPAGMGMGLSITRSILEAHGGRIWAANNPDRGASIWFTLPAHDRPTP